MQEYPSCSSAAEGANHLQLRCPSGSGSRNEEGCSDNVLHLGQSSSSEGGGARAEADDQQLYSHSNNMLDRITDDLNFLLNGAAEDMITFTPAHHLHAEKPKLATIQENMVGISEEFEMRTSASSSTLE